MSTTSSMEGNYSPSSPQDLAYPYASSTVYSDRPIRPLPKRRLRSRLSPEAVDSILFPQSSSVAKGKANDEKQLREPGDEQSPTSGKDSYAQERIEIGSYQFRGNEIANGAEELADDEPHRNQWHQKKISLGGNSLRNNHVAPRIKPSIAPSAASSADSVDGYDSFENTNNKKKRKIPISGSLGNHHSSLSSDLASMDISSSRDLDGAPGDADTGIGQYYTSSNSIGSGSTYMSNSAGGGKTRHGRLQSRRYSGRSPLGPSVNGSNTLQPGRSPHIMKDSSAAYAMDTPAQPSSELDEPLAAEVIKTVMATQVGAQDGASPDPSTSKGSSSTKTQFTFTCDSDSVKNVTWPGYGYSPVVDGRDDSAPYRGGGQAAARAGRGVATQGTQTSPNMAEQANQNQTSINSPSSPGAQPRKPRRSLAKQLALAARERRLQQDYENYNNPPRDDKIWVCEFCEYESIFGHPPEALIRQYEIKDRREQRRLAEKRRLLEKAKMKGKKGKKGTKNNKNSNAALSQQGVKQRADAQSTDPNITQSPEDQSEDYILDEYEDEPIPMPSTASQVPSKIPQPVGQSHNHSPRPPGGTAVASVGG